MREYNIKRITHRQNESTEEKKARLEKENLRKRCSRKDESLEQREQRIAKMRQHKNRKKNQRQNESTEEKKARLEKENPRKRCSKKDESLEQKEQRLAKMREYKNRKKNQRQNESTEEKKARLAKEHLRKKSSRTEESLEQRRQKENIGNHQPTNTQILTESLIRNFHESVSTGPLYICTCCDQLWYKHSVSPVNRLTLNNPDVLKYLQEIVSVDNIKWVCQTCSKHLKKGKIPPCANGIFFT